MTLPVMGWNHHAALSHGKLLTPLEHDAFTVNEQRLIRSTERIAATLQEAGIQCERTDCLPLFLVHSITDEIVEVRPWRNIDILPMIAVPKRRRDALDLEAFCTKLNRHRLRMRLSTSGPRCTVDQVGERIGFLLQKHGCLAERKWFSDVAELISVGIEFPVVRGKSKHPVRDRKGRLLYHVHAHTVYRLTRWLTDEEWQEFGSKWHDHFGTYCPDSGKIKDLREACKYPLKSADLEVVRKQGELVALFHQLKRRHLFQPYSDFRAFRRYLRDHDLTVKRIHRASGKPQLVFVAKQPSTRVHYHRDRPSRSPAVDIFFGRRRPRASQKNPRMGVWEMWGNLVSTPAEARRKRNIKVWTPPAAQPATPPKDGAGQVHTVTLNTRLTVDGREAVQDQVTYTLRAFIPRPPKP